MLIDRFGRKIEYLRISVTDRCDLRCNYCIPKGFKNFEESTDWLSFAEITHVAGAFARLGVRRLRLTGGEPLLRKNLPRLASQLSALPGLEDLSLSTNGTQLAQQAHALFAAGVKRLNVSLDTLKSDCAEAITGSKSLEKVLAGLAAAKQAGFSRIKINMVPQPGINEHEIDDVAAFCIQQGFILRLIEAMPMGITGQGAARLNLQPVLQRLSQKFSLLPISETLGGGPARYWQSQDGQFTLGLITPLSQHFCASCNRVRLTAEGRLYLCLGQEASIDLRPLLRADISEPELEATLHAALELKPEKHEFVEVPHKIMRIMAKTGG